MKCTLEGQDGNQRPTSKKKIEFMKNLMEQDDEIDEDLTTFSKKVLRLPLIK